MQWGEYSMVVLVLGATGLVGSKVMDLLLQDENVQKIHVLGRRSCGIDHPKINEFIGPLSEMAGKSAAFHVDAVYCCLGTTIKTAGSKEAFRAVDYQYPLDAGKIAKECGVETFVVVSALGSKANSKIFYNRVKGEMERDLSQIGLKNLYIVRPSIIIGERNESRPGEAFGIMVAKIMDPLFIGPLRKYAGSKVEEIAGLMHSLVNKKIYNSAIEFEKL